MSDSLNAPLNSQVESEPLGSPGTRATRPFYWSVRRELWEHRSIFVAPLAVAGVVLLGDLVSLIGLPHSVHKMATLDPSAPQTAALAQPYSHAAFLLLLTGLLVGIFYSLDALHGERRDRSILFWKSLPVSDLVTVLSKAVIPILVLPLVVFAITIGVQWLMRLVSTVVLVASGVGASTLWSDLPLLQMQLVLLYGLIALTLWHAPIYCWLLLVSGWAKRATFLWAVLPPIAIGVFEKIAFHSSFFGDLMKNRLFGFAGRAFRFDAPGHAPVDPHFIPLDLLTPGRFLSSPGLWLGLGAAAAFLAAAVRLRRYREPI